MADSDIIVSLNLVIPFISMVYMIRLTLNQNIAHLLYPNMMQIMIKFHVTFCTKHTIETFWEWCNAASTYSLCLANSKMFCQSCISPTTCRYKLTKPRHCNKLFFPYQFLLVQNWNKVPRNLVMLTRKSWNRPNEVVGSFLF